MPELLHKWKVRFQCQVGNLYGKFCVLDSLESSLLLLSRVWCIHDDKCLVLFMKCNT